MHIEENQKLVSQLDADGYFFGPAIADESPLEPGVFLLPAGAVECSPPSVPDGKRAKYVEGKFIFETIPGTEPPPPPTAEEIAAIVSASRQRAYEKESDPLFFKWQRGESTKDEWLQKVEEIKARFPDGVLPS
jgi:hypothetical protein